MIRGVFLILIGLAIAGVIVLLPPNLWLEQDQQVKSLQTPKQSSGFKLPKKQTYALTSIQQKGNQYIKLHELQKKLSVITKIDHKNGRVELTDEKIHVVFLKDVAVVEINGLFYPMKTPLLYQQNQIFLPSETVAKIFAGTTKVKNGAIQLSVNVAKQQPPAIPATIKQLMKADQLIDYLGFLQNPIKDAHVSTQNSSLPGAPRTYRKGVHEGIDWYGGKTTGVPITKRTPVQAMADGIVVRADHGYREMTTFQREKLLALGRHNHGQTPQYVLDKLRGRSVWIQHHQGVMARYVHLERIPSGLKVGQKIKQGDLIGYVGNSGTSDGAKGNNEGVHLHLDLFIYGKWLWDRYSMQERRMILEKVFPKDG